MKTYKAKQENFYIFSVNNIPEIIELAEQLGYKKYSIEGSSKDGLNNYVVYFSDGTGPFLNVPHDHKVVISSFRPSEVVEMLHWTKLASQYEPQ